MKSLFKQERRTFAGATAAISALIGFLPTGATNGKLQGLQVARAIAAVMVVAFHAKLVVRQFPKDSYFKLPFIYDQGEVGVLLFFVISGFIIAHIVQSHSFSVSSFAIKRIWRLWPPYVLATTVYFLILAFTKNYSLPEIASYFESLVKSYAIWPQPGYPILNTGWSLEHEVIFYIYAALIAGFFGYRVFFWFMVGISIAGAVYHFVFPLFGLEVYWDWHLLAGNNSYFGVGVVLHKFWRSHPTVANPTLSLIVGAATVVVGMYASDQFKDQGAMQLFRLGIVGFGSSLLLYGLLNADYRGWTWRALIWLGDRSYSLYLVHFLYIPIFSYTNRKYAHWPEYMAEPLCVAFIVASIGTAAVMYKFVERPSLQLGRRIAAKHEAKTSAV